MINRRSIVVGLGLLSQACRSALAQSRFRVARLGVLMDLPATDPAGIARVAALMDGLAALGWKLGSTLDLQIRWATDDRAQRRRDAEALLAARPDVLFTSASPPTREAQDLTRTVPIVFTTVIDPVGAGFVESLNRPGGNITGFTNLEPSISAKWVQILLEVDPRIEQIITVMEKGLRASELQAEYIASAARTAGLPVVTVDLMDEKAVQSAFEKTGRRSGAVLTSSPSATARRLSVIGAAERFKVPTMYPGRHHVVAGGLISYGPDLVDPFRQAASYVDRILRGEAPALLPVQMPTRQEMVLNAQTARSIDITFSQALLARADEVID